MAGTSGQVWNEFERRCGAYRVELNGIRAEISALEARRDPSASTGRQRGALTTIISVVEH